MLLKRLFNLKSICRNSIKNIVLIFTISGSCLIGCNNKNEKEDYRGISDLQIIIFNKDTNKEEICAIFN